MLRRWLRRRAIRAAGLVIVRVLWPLERWMYDTAMRDLDDCLLEVERDYDFGKITMIEYQVRTNHIWATKKAARP